MSAVPDISEVVILDLDPQAGHEQQGRRPALVLSPKTFNQQTGFAWVCPITNEVKGYPFEVKVTGSRKTTGVVLADQLKSLDWSARKVRIVDQVNQDCLSQVQSLIHTILGM